MQPIKLFNQVEKLREQHMENARMSSARNRVEDVQLFFHEENVFAEPGYSATVAALGNWNTVLLRNENFEEKERDETPSKLCKALDELGVHTDWEDEWAVCGECNRLVRTTPDCYGWMPNYVELYGTYVCHECVCGSKKCMEDYLESIEGVYSKCLTFVDLDLSEHGYTRVLSGLERGMHCGQDASPEKIAKKLSYDDIERFIFQLDSSGQFDISFSVWVHDSELGKYDDLSDDEINGESVSGRIESALRSVSGQQADLRKQQSETGGVIVTKVTPDGASTRLVSREEFVDGIRD